MFPCVTSISMSFRLSYFLYYKEAKTDYPLYCPIGCNPWDVASGRSIKLPNIFPYSECLNSGIIYLILYFNALLFVVCHMSMFFLNLSNKLKIKWTVSIFIWKKCVSYQFRLKCTDFYCKTKNSFKFDYYRCTCIYLWTYFVIYMNTI